MQNILMSYRAIKCNVRDDLYARRKGIVSLVEQNLFCGQEACALLPVF